MNKLLAPSFQLKKHIWLQVSDRGAVKSVFILKHQFFICNRLTEGHVQLTMVPYTLVQQLRTIGEEGFLNLIKYVRAIQDIIQLFPRYFFCMWLEVEQKALRGRCPALYIQSVQPWVACSRNRFWQLEAEKEHTQAILTHGVLLRLCRARKLGTIAPIILQSLPSEATDVAEP